MTARVRVGLKERSYDILIGPGLIDRAGDIIKKLSVGNCAVIVTNADVARLFGRRLTRSLAKSGIASVIETVPDTEKAKSAGTLMRLLGGVSARDYKKTVFFIALGGGVVGDLTGFAAAVYKRGVPYIQVPTTLLAQVDSAIGGKTAIDLPAAKNLVGSFYQPKAVISDATVLKLLPKRQLKSALAECIKYGVIKDARLFRYIERNYTKILALDAKALTHIVGACSRIKAAIVGRDEFDRTGLRVILNYGHTVGHAIESAAGYSQTYTHGEAVAIGMACADIISSRLGILKKADAARIGSLIRKCGLPVKAPGLDAGAVYRSLLRDKKFVRAKNRFVLPETIGKVRVVEGISEHVVKGAIKETVKKD
jgi:3-dehydroquinate synthase